MKRVLLLGAGHAQLAVLEALARGGRRPPVEWLLVSPGDRFLYSGRVPGWVAGRFDPGACSFALAPVAQAAGVEFLQGRAVALDAAAQCVTLADGRQLEYDLLSLDTGGTQDRDRLPGARDNALFLRPLEGFAQLWRQTLVLAGERALDVIVVGGGAAGTEIALAVRQALERPATVTLVADGGLLPGHAAGARRRAEFALQQHDIQLLPGRCTAIEPWHVCLGNLRVACDVPIIATGSDAPAWLRTSRLALDAEGFVSTGPTLQSTSHPNVFATGDVSARADHPHPRSGVHAVRAGPVLSRNLLGWLAGARLSHHTPQRRALYLLSTGNGRAIASWGGLSAEGRWAGRWKDRLDGAFLARYSGLGPAPSRSQSA